MSEILSLWKKYLLHECNYSLNTVESYISDLNILKKFLLGYEGHDTSIQNIDKQTIRAWILYRQNQKDKQKSIARGLSAIKNLHRFMMRNGLIKERQILNMRTPKVWKTLPRPLTIQQLNCVIESIAEVKQTKWIIKRDIALVVLIYSVGLRISEALLIRFEDIVNNSEFINVIGKGGKSRMVPLVHNVMKVIKDYLDICPYSSEFIFVNKDGKRLRETSVQKLLQKIRRLLGLPENITPHSLRHTCATHLLENSGNLRGIQELLGHSSLNSTQIYVDVTKRKMAEIYEKCHPLAKKTSQ
jgi:integrase/recombinase XerC